MPGIKRNKQMGERGRASPTVWLCYCLSCFPPEEQCPWYRCWDFMFYSSTVLHVWFEHFHCLSDTLRFMDNGRDGHWVAVRPSDLFAQSKDWGMYGWQWRSLGLQALLILAMSWLGKCVEIICDSDQGVSCGRGGHTRQLAHTSTPKLKRKKKKRRSMDDISCGPSCWTGLWMGAVIEKSR